MPDRWKSPGRSQFVSTVGIGVAAHSGRIRSPQASIIPGCGLQVAGCELQVAPSAVATLLIKSGILIGMGYGGHVGVNGLSETTELTFAPFVNFCLKSVWREFFSWENAPQPLRPSPSKFVEIVDCALRIQLVMRFGDPGLLMGRFWLTSKGSVSSVGLSVSSSWPISDNRCSS